MSLIDWAEPALHDLQAIHDFLARDSEPYAKALLQRILLAVDQLEEFPLLGRAVPEAKGVPLRELLVHPYRVMYRLRRKRRVIVALVHNARDLRGVKPRPWRR